MNRHGLSAAAGRLNQVQDITADQRASVARQLIRLYNEAGMEPPSHLHELAGARSAAPAGNAEVRVGVERRVTPLRVELRGYPTGDNPRMTIGGHAATFNSPSRLIPGHSGHAAFVERVAPSFFDQEQRSGWAGPQGAGICCRFNHSNDWLLGTTQAGTLRLAVDGIGLDFSCDLPEHRSDIGELVARGDVNASSFTFIVDDSDGDEWSYTPSGGTQRTLLSGRLVDVAPVGGALAAYPDATVALRSLARFMDAPYEDVEMYWRSGELGRFFTRSDLPPEREPAMSNPYSSPTMDWRTAHDHRTRHLIEMLTKFPPTTPEELHFQQRERAKLRAQLS